jgi:6-phosphogluconolactonase
VIVVEGPRAAAAEAARCVAAEIERVLAAREWCWIALPGGHSMAAVYEHLAAYSLDWSRVEFFFTDERCVPPSHPASSYGEAADRLFTNPRIGAHQVHRMEAERADHEAVAAEYAEELPEVFDVVLLEMGSDGHVASLFPHSKAFDQADQPVVVLETALKPRWRLSLAPAVLAQARAKVVLATGQDRAASVRAALVEDGPASELPARLVRDGTWILDRPAAARLG